MLFAAQNRMTEIPLLSAKQYPDPFHNVTLDAIFTAPDGSERRVPAFWAGDDHWKVRYASPQVGQHHYRTLCSDVHNNDLHDQQGTIDVRAYSGTNPLYRHGPLHVSQNRCFLQHQDGTPFFWLGDTWWHGLAGRFHWPEDFYTLSADRVAKGFTVVQIVAGLMPELTADRFWGQWDANEAGWAWEKDFARINPRFFDLADLRIDLLVESGLLPCLVSGWGYYLKYAGIETMKAHWRYLVARYGAYPIVWCLAGEKGAP